MKQQKRYGSIVEAFKQKYGALPTTWARAPGRVDLMGSHTDYNMGYVMTMAVDRDTWIAARPRNDRQVQIVSLNLPGAGSFSLDDIAYDTAVPWTNYIRGLAKAMQEAGYNLSGFDGLVHSTVPFSSGLSSSAAIEMAAAVTFKLVGGFEIDPVEMALLGQKAENQFVGINSGILDQYSSTMGKAGSALLLDCRQLTSRTLSIARGLRVVVCDTRAKRNLTGSEYDERRAQCEEGVRILRQFYPEIEALRDVSLDQLEAKEQALPEVVAKRCRFVIEENQRVLDLAELLPAGNSVEEPGPLRALFSASYTGARDLYEIGAPSMEAMMKAMMSGPGVVAGRQAGAGFGGCMVALVQEDTVGPFTTHVERVYEATFGRQPAVYPVEAAPGAGLLGDRGVK